MTIQFNYNEEDSTMTYTTIDGLHLQIYFDGTVATHVSFNKWDDIDYKGNDNLKGLYADASRDLLKPDLRPIVWFVHQAETLIEDYMRECKIEATNWARHVNSYKSPR